MNLISYQAPKWFLANKLVNSYAKSNSNINNNLLKKIPKYRFDLVNKKPTVIQKLNLSEFIGYKNLDEYEFYVKRDDQTHDELFLQGNKLRKLEFLFADAIQNFNAKHILTAGGLQSNHCRAVASVCNKLGLDAHLFLRSHTSDPNTLKNNGNLLLDRLLGANIYLIEKKAQYAESIRYKMNLLEDLIRKKYSQNPYVIPIGGSNLVGLFGYLECFAEMLDEQRIDEFITDIVITCGSGGTMTGLALANYLTGSKFGLHAFCVCDNSNYFYNHLKEQLIELFDDDDEKYSQEIPIKSLVNIIECSKGLGYAQSTKDELEFLIQFFKKTNILLDPVYTGKTFYTLLNLISNKSPTFSYENDLNAKNFRKNLKGNRILFIHTGGQLGLFDNGKFDSIFTNSSSSSKAFNWFGDNTNFN